GHRRGDGPGRAGDGVRGRVHPGPAGRRVRGHPRRPGHHRGVGRGAATRGGAAGATHRAGRRRGAQGGRTVHSGRHDGRVRGRDHGGPVKVLWLSPWMRTLARVYVEALHDLGHECRLVTSDQHYEKTSPRPYERVLDPRPKDPKTYAPLLKTLREA